MYLLLLDMYIVVLFTQNSIIRNIGVNIILSIVSFVLAYYVFFGVINNIVYVCEYIML